MRVVLLVMLSVVVVMGDRFSPAEYHSSFTRWMTTHSKTYTPIEFSKRYSTYKKNMDFVDEFNKRNESFTVALNVFADLTVEEFAALLLNPIPKEIHNHTAQEFTAAGVRVPRTTNFDWRSQNAVTAIKDQGQCGSCWTFAAAGAIESEYFISTGTLPTLSEQNLLDCVQGSNGCNGGSFMSAFLYVASNGGIDTMSSYPYTGVQSTTCHYTSANNAATITSYQRVIPNSETALLSAVASQPVSVAIQGNLTSFQFYSSGIYNDASCTAAAIDHAVIVIGYGNDATTGYDYWTFKNSWGTSWGESGFGQMRRGVNMCGIASQPAFPSRQSIAGWVFQDYFFNTWALYYAGTVTSISYNTAGVSGVSFSATIAPNSRIVPGASPSYSTTGYTTLNFAIMTSAASSCGYNIGSTTKTVATSTSWTTVSATLSSLGSVNPITYISFYNYGASTVVMYIDNIHFS